MATAVASKDKSAHSGAPVLLTVQESADRLGISKRTMQRRIESGFFDPVDVARPGARHRAVRVPIEQIEAATKPAPLPAVNIDVMINQLVSCWDSLSADQVSRIASVVKGARISE